MKLVIMLGLSAVFGVSWATTASAQLSAATQGPIAYGHHHLNVTDVDEHMKFWVDTLGGTTVPFGDRQIVKYLNTWIVMTERAPSGGTKGTTVNHIGFMVPDVRAALEKVRAGGYPIVTSEEVPSFLEVTDDMAYVADQDTYIAFVMAPDDVKVELLQDPNQRAPIASHHIHFAAEDVDEMKAWYVKTFDAVPGMRGSFEAADLPGVNLTYSPSPDPLAGTQGRSLDHIGFEVDGLEALCRRLEEAGVVFDRPYAEIESLDIAIAFFTDPFGTYIELTEGLDKY